MSKLIKVVTALAAVAGMSIPANAQQFPTETAVVETCVAVAKAELSADASETNPLRGQCIAATQAYVVDIGNRGLSDAEYDQQLSNLVVVLAEILFNPQCLVESEIAQAISLANASVIDPEQQAQIVLIYETVNACDFVITAAIFTPSQANLGGESSGSPQLPQASQN